VVVVSEQIVQSDVNYHVGYKVLHPAVQAHNDCDVAARGTLIGHACRCQDLGLSWKSASSGAGCVEGSHDRRLSAITLWADCDFSGREPGNVRRSFAVQTLERKPNDSVSFEFVRSRSGFV